MNWFERLTGFKEVSYAETLRQLDFDGQQIHSLVNEKKYGVGNLELVSLEALRKRVGADRPSGRRLRLSSVSGDARKMHRDPELAGALFQVASQFNLLEMVGPEVAPEQGVGIYEGDPTQGPACAIAAGGGTIYRNYFVPIDGTCGQTRERQLDGLADVGDALGSALGVSRESLWTMRNGYALCTQSALEAISGHLNSLDSPGREQLKGKLRIGVHRLVEVTDLPPPRPVVSQAFCSALPVRYSHVPAAFWAPFAQLVLEAAYEATIWAGVENARQGGSTTVLLTRLGGGAFGNSPEWIDAAMRGALEKALSYDLDVRIVAFGKPSPATTQLIADLQD